jgi:hypothetical protein
MARVLLTGSRPRASEASLAGVLQAYTGLPHPDALRLVRHAAKGVRVEVEIDDDVTAYDLAALLSDLGVVAEVDESG